jgi:5-methylcytosine-specific restriction endonuclease McrA
VKNPRITPKEWGLLKGALRRVFARSELHAEAVKLTRIDFKDLTRPRVTKWSRCMECKLPTPTYKIEVDHLKPVVPLNKEFSQMSLDEAVNNLWCPISDLQGLCHTCHNVKTKQERLERKRLKGAKK